MIPNMLVKMARVPLCPYCNHPMQEDHLKGWTGVSWHYLSINFECNSNTHRVIIKARTAKEWKDHRRVLKFLR